MTDRKGYVLIFDAGEEWLLKPAYSRKEVERIVENTEEDFKYMRIIE